MPESRDRLIRGSTERDIPDGFEIRRGFYPAVVARPVVRNRIQWDNKENIPLSGSWSTQRRRKSPLPSWYPRTPLGDITAIANAMERRRIRLQVARATALRRRNQSIESSSPFVLPSSPLGQEVSVSEQTPAREVAPTVVSETSVTPSTTDCPPQTSSSPTKPTSEGSKFTEPDKKLWSSFDEIENVLMEILKKNTTETVKKTAKRSTRFLMSMR